jgi:AcrR family transcriptional regulator
MIAFIVCLSLYTIVYDVHYSVHSDASRWLFTLYAPDDQEVAMSTRARAQAEQGVRPRAEARLHAGQGVQPGAKRRGRRRAPLTRERVLRAAIILADKEGIEFVTMRRLGDELGVGPMALYRHVRNKEDLVDGIVDVVFDEIGLPPTDADWKEAMRQRAFSVREVLSRHRWAIGLMESRLSPGPANLRHHDAVIGCLRAAGFDIAMVAHAYSALDSYIYGFAATQMNLPFEGRDEIAEVAQSMLRPFPFNAYPHLTEMLTDHVMRPGYDYGDEFAYGLDLILDGLDRARDGRR